MSKGNRFFTKRKLSKNKYSTYLKNDRSYIFFWKYSICKVTQFKYVWRTCYVYSKFLPEIVFPFDKWLWIHKYVEVLCLLRASDSIYCLSWDPLWRHQMETFSALLAICAGNSPVTGEFPAQTPVTRSFDFFFDLRLNKRLGNNGDAGDMRRHRAHYDVAVMKIGIVPTEFQSVMAYDLGPIGFAMVASQCPTYSTWLGWLPSKPSFGLWRNASVIHVQNMHSVWLFFC